MSFLLGEAYDDVEEEMCELERFLMLPAVHVDSDPLLWWKTHEQSYLTLSKVAKRYLSIPATSVPSERTFSAAGLLVNKQRSRLLPENVDRLIFLNKNLSR